MRETSERLEEKHATNPPSWCTNYWCFLHQEDIGRSRSFIPVVRWSCELRRTIMRTIVYPYSGPFYKVIALCLALLCIGDEQCYNGGELRAQEVH
jgi:hypothetical protein